jgi:hypothetical protein
LCTIEAAIDGSDTYEVRLRQATYLIEHFNDEPRTIPALSTMKIALNENANGETWMVKNAKPVRLLHMIRGMTALH